MRPSGLISLSSNASRIALASGPDPVPSQYSENHLKLPIAVRAVARDRLATALKAFYTDHGRCATMLEWALKKDGLDAVLQDLRAAPEKFGRLRDAGSRTRKQSKPSVRVDSVAAELTELFTRIGGADQ